MKFKMKKIKINIIKNTIEFINKKIKIKLMII